MEGDLDEVVQALLLARKAEQLEELEVGMGAARVTLQARWREAAAPASPAGRAVAAAARAGAAAGDRAWLMAHDDDALPPSALAGLPGAVPAGCRRTAGLPGRREGILRPAAAGRRARAGAPAGHRDAGRMGAGSARPAGRRASSTWAPAAAPSRWRSSHAGRMRRWKRSTAAPAPRRGARQRQRLGLPVQVPQADWLAGAGRYDLVVSNPPYVAAGDPHLPALRHEPQSALVAGPDGLDDLRRIVAAAPGHLRPAAGCCWSTAGTRPRPCAGCWRRGLGRRGFQPRTWRASSAAPAAPA
jgi:release factor glutamine methyltransferase